MAQAQHQTEIALGINDTSLGGLVKRAIEFYLNHNAGVQRLIERFNLEE